MEIFKGDSIVKTNLNEDMDLENLKSEIKILKENITKLNKLIIIDESNKEITITIEDNGPGIPKKDYEKALRPFQRLDSSRNQNIAGSGLGLSISQEIMNSIGGNIKLSKSKLGGLKVIMALPLKGNI